MSLTDRLRARKLVSRPPLQRAAWFALGFFTLIVTTGAAVRLTGSGLGCSHWPNCTDQSFAPQNGHAYIEYANRLMSTPVSISALACLFFATIQREVRRDYIVIGRILVLLVLAQALLGGVAVLTDLKWQTVSPHYLLSAFSLSVCVVLVWRLRAEAGKTAALADQHALFGQALRLLAAFGAVVLSIGTFVTAAGPYAGGAGTGDVVERLSVFGADTFPTMVMIHARIAAVYGVLAVVAWIYARRARATAVYAPLTALCVLVGIAGVIGQLQYHVFDYPAALVWGHVVVATLMWVASTWLWLAARPAVARPAL